MPKALVASSGKSAQILNTDTLETGAGLDRATAGALAIGASTATSVVVTPPTTIQGITVGRGGGAVSTNTAVGASALSAASLASQCVAIGFGAAANLTGNNIDSVAVGFQAEAGTTSLGQNTVVGAAAGGSITSGTNLTLIGYNAEPTSGTASDEITLGDGNVNTFRIGTPTPGLPNPGFTINNLSAGGATPRTRVSIGHTGNSASASFVDFYIAAISSGGIRQAAGGGTPLVYATTSDYRVKADVQPIEAPLDRLAALKPCRFHFSTNNVGSPLVEGFIAHEVQEVVPQAVTGTKDEIDADGNPVLQGMDQAHLVPLLTAACQELAAQAAAATARAIEAERRLDALEAAFNSLIDV